MNVKTPPLSDQYRNSLRGLTANEILSLPPHSQTIDFFYRSMAWLDFLRRTKAPSALHYCAIEFRYGIEHLGFELLDAAKGIGGEAEYSGLVNHFDEIERRMKNDVQIARFTQFNRITMAWELARNSQTPEPLILDFSHLMRLRWEASKFLHFCGSIRTTHLAPEWVHRAWLELGSIVSPLWEMLVDNPLVAYSRPTGRGLDAWQLYSVGKIDDDQVREILDGRQA